MKIFAVSDVHSFFTIMHNALKEKGFEENNPNHLLVVCGDAFDRGPESKEMLEYLMSLNNVVLIRGNHEDLLEEMFERGYAQSHDMSNGTLKTVNDILYSQPDKLDGSRNGFEIVQEIVQPYMDRLVNYFETKNYVFVHGYIPLKSNDDMPYYYTRHRRFDYDPDWRNATEEGWAQARWINGVEQANKGLLCDKTVVVGHWHCSWGHMWADIREKGFLNATIDDYGPTAIWEPYYGEKIVAIDRCTAYTNMCNVLVIEDDLLEDEPHDDQERDLCQDT